MLYIGQSMSGGVACETMSFERDPECMHRQDTKEKVVAVGRRLTVRAFVDEFVLAHGALDLATVVPGDSCSKHITRTTPLQWQSIVPGTG